MLTDRPVAKAAAPHVSNRTAPSTGKNFPNSADYYPPASMRLGEEGLGRGARLCRPERQAVREPTVAKTSGSARLDEGAIKLAKAGHYNSVRKTVNR